MSTARNNRNVRPIKGTWYSRWADRHIKTYHRRNRRYVGKR